jgi:hypothetical protein
MQFAQTTSQAASEIGLHYRVGPLNVDNTYLARVDIRLRPSPAPATEFDPVRCPPHVDDIDAFPQAFHIARAEILIASRPDWFTQPDTMRATWERCGSDLGFSIDVSHLFLCTKLFDFGSVVAHELGHVLGLHHPDQIEPLAPGASNDARCTPPWANALSQATMCRTTYTYRSAGRTLDLWDLDTIRVHQGTHA